MRIVDWRPEDGEDDDAFATLPDNLRHGLKESTTFNLVLNWVELRCIDVVVAEIGEEVNGSDPLRPVFRTKLEAARERLLAVKEHLEFLRVEVVQREPLEDEVQETREWLDSLPATSQ